MEIEFPIYGEGSECAKVKKRPWDENGIQIGRQHDNDNLDTRVQEFEYLDGHEASISAKEIAENLFEKVDEEGNIFLLFDDISNHCVDGTETMQQDSFIISKNGGKIIRETTKVWEILIHWKYGSMTWESIRDVKEC